MKLPEFLRTPAPKAAPPKSPLGKHTGLLVVVLQCEDEFALAKDENNNISPLLIPTDNIAEHSLNSIDAVLRKEDIEPEHVYLVPHEINLQPLIPLTLHLVIVTVSEAEFIRAKVNGFNAPLSSSRILLERDSNIFLDLLARHLPTKTA